MIDTLLTEIDDIVCSEYARANKEHPAFASDHEGHDVLHEEVTEAVAEMEKVKVTIGAMSDAIRKNDQKAVATIAKATYNAAYHLAAEAVQVAAMALKIQTSQKLREKTKWQPPFLK